MVWKAALAIALQASATEAPEANLFYWVGGNGSEYVAYKDEAKVLGTSGRISVWLRGFHSKDKTVPYRTSHIHVTVTCYGSYEIDAWTTYKANGQVLKDWNGSGYPTRIRPGTMYDALERFLCTK